MKHTLKPGPSPKEQRLTISEEFAQRIELRQQVDKWATARILSYNTANRKTLFRKLSEANHPCSLSTINRILKRPALGQPRISQQALTTLKDGMTAIIGQTTYIDLFTNILGPDKPNQPQNQTKDK